MSDIFGRGMRMPLGLSGSGGIAEAEGEEKVEESIRILLGTQYGERVMRPRFGCNLKSLVFAPNTPETANLARYYVEEGLRTWEPRIDLLDVVVDNDNANGTLVIHVTYRLRSTRAVETLIHLFDLEPTA